MYIARISVALLLCFAGAFAQGTDPEQSGGREPFVPEALQSEISLLDSQIEFLRQNNISLRDELRPLAREMSDYRRQLRRETQSDSPSEAIVGAITMEIERIDDQMSSVREKYREIAIQSLGEEQVAALMPLQEAAELWHVVRQAAAFNLVAVPEVDSDGEQRRSRSRRGATRR